MFNNIGTNKVVQGNKIEEVKQKLDEVDEKEKINEITNEVGNNENPELNVLLKQLTKYLETK